MASSTSLPFFAREKEALKLLTFDPSKDGTLVERTGEPFPLPTPKAAQWSPDGLALALIDPTSGVQVLAVSEDGRDMVVHTLEACPKTTQAVQWSPRASALVTMAPGTKGMQEPNVHVWRSRDGAGGGFECHASFSYPKLEKDKKVFQWSSDERLCARLLPDGKLQVLDGSDLSGAALAELSFAHGVQAFEFAPLRPRGGVKARLAVFVPDTRDDLQRVVGPAEVTVWDFVTSGTDPRIQAQERVRAEVASGQLADLLWNCTGVALIAHCQTEVDESGQSYYGGSKLMFLSHDGEYKKDLTEAETSSSGTSVQAVAWSPSRDEFILIQGFQPAQAALWSWDERAKKVTVAKVLLEKAHRNTIRFNQFGSLVCLAGFGNLAGEVDFFGRPDSEKCDFVRVSSCTANCTVSAEWAPDGRHFLTSVLAPRMRVDNGASIWFALAGTKVSGMEFPELYDTQWRPEPPNSLRFLDVSFEEVASAGRDLANKGAAEGSEKKRQAYRPPKARGEGASTVAAMMRGEVAAPDADDRRARKSRQVRQKEEDHSEPIRGEQEHRDRKELAPADPEPEQPSPVLQPSQPPTPAREQREVPRQPPPPPPQEAPPPRQQQQPTQARSRDAHQAAAAAAAAAEAQAQAHAEAAAGGYPSAARQAAAQQAAAAYAAAAPQRQAPAPQPAQHQRAVQAQQQLQLQQQQQQQEQQRQQQQQQQQHLQQQQLQQQQLAARQAQQAQKEATAQQQQQQQQQARQPARFPPPQQAAQAPLLSQGGGQGHGAKLPCPATGWQYVDPKRTVQGPFSLMEMQQWNSMGYFRPDLLMRCDSQDQFLPFAELFPHPLIPFQSYPNRPAGSRVHRAMR